MTSEYCLLLMKLLNYNVFYLKRVAKPLFLYNFSISLQNKVGGYMKKENNYDCNCGVKCNVNNCVYNEDGCNCNKETIEVSLGDGEPMSNGIQKHFCKSFISRDKCDCKDCHCTPRYNVEASDEYIDDFHSPYNKPYDEY